MPLEYKEDWDETKQRYKAWWNGEYFGRCAVWVTAPRENAPGNPSPKTQEDPIERWTNLDFIAAQTEYHLSRTFYGGEAFPHWSPGYPGTGSLATFLGCPLYLDHATGWSEPILTDDNWDIRKLQIDHQNRWWKFTIDWLKRGASESAGKSIPSIGAFGGSGDTLAAVRGTLNLLYDIADTPEKVRKADEYLMEMWLELYDTFYGIVRESSDGGSTCWFHIWAPGKMYAVQNDFSYMISPRMFREVFLPVIERQTEFLDYSIYHVDGVEAFAHVPALCELPKLQALQILPGAGKPGPLHYMETLKAVQAAGKNLHIGIPIHEVEYALKMLSAKGLFIQTGAATEDEARDLLKKVENWSIYRRN